MIELQYTILLPIAAGIILFIFPEKIKVVKGIISVLVSAAVLYYAYRLFKMSSQMVAMDMIPGFSDTGDLAAGVMVFNLDNLSKTIGMFIGFFGFLSRGFYKTDVPLRATLRPSEDLCLRHLSALGTPLKCL